MANVVRRLQLTLALIKPDVTVNPLIEEEIKNLLLSQNFLFVKTKSFKWTQQQAKHFYRQHAERFFYGRLVNFMSRLDKEPVARGVSSEIARDVGPTNELNCPQNGPITGLILCRENAIGHWRELMGPTKVYRAIYEAPDSVRGSFGLTDTRNSTHGSDSDESAAAEIAMIFPGFNIAKWYETVEPKFRLGHVQFNSENGTHEILAELKKSQF